METCLTSMRCRHGVCLCNQYLVQTFISLEGFQNLRQKSQTHMFIQHPAGNAVARFMG